MKYNVIYADPPWCYRNKKTGGSMKSGAAHHYPTMTLDELRAFPIDKIREKSSVLFLWATVPLLPDALQLMAAWGYKYKTAITWRKLKPKDKLGIGYWWRGEVEHLLFGVRGQIPAFRMSERNYIEHPLLRHSQKPEAFRHLINRAANKAKLNRRIELFARWQAPEWDVFGNEVENSIAI